MMFSLSLRYMSLTPLVSFPITDHPINPPSNDDPFLCEYLDDGGFCLKPKGGVMHVYRDRDALNNDQPLDFPYPKLAEFLFDQSIMFALMADGPM